MQRRHPKGNHERPQHRRTFPPPPMPFGPGMVRNLSKLVFLWTIAAEKDGITGYDLQKKYQAKQTSVYRLLGKLEGEGYLKTNETIVKGRAQKLYSITEKGRKHLAELRAEWASKLAFLTDIAPPEARPFVTFRFRSFTRGRRAPPRPETREEALKYLDAVERQLEGRKTHLQRRTTSVNQHIQKIQQIREKLLELEYSPELFEKLLKEATKRPEKKRINREH